jgi:hypothetical protein
MNRWKSIWENKTEVHSQNILNSLIKSDGFDSVYAQYTNQEWESICNKIVAHSKFDINSKTIEIGCGSGAIIYCISMFNGGGGGGRWSGACAPPSPRPRPAGGRKLSGTRGPAVWH